MMPPVHVPVNLRLCYITDRLTLHPTPLLPFIERAIIAGVDLIQIREKDLGTRPLIDLVKPAVESARSTRTRILVNDRLDVALGAGAILGRRFDLTNEYATASTIFDEVAARVPAFAGLSYRSLGETGAPAGGAAERAGAVSPAGA